MSSTELLPRPMTIEEFQPLLGKTIVAECSPKNADLTLAEVTPLKDHGVVARPPFILIFHSDHMIQLTAGIYALRSGRFGPAAVYLEPTGALPNAVPGNYYQAVFN